MKLRIGAALGKRKRVSLSISLEYFWKKSMMDKNYILKCKQDYYENRKLEWRRSWRIESAPSVSQAAIVYLERPLLASSVLSSFSLKNCARISDGYISFHPFGWLPRTHLFLKLHICPYCFSFSISPFLDVKRAFLPSLRGDLEKEIH